MHASVRQAAEEQAHTVEKCRFAGCFHPAFGAPQITAQAAGKTSVAGNPAFVFIEFMLAILAYHR